MKDRRFRDSVFCQCVNLDAEVLVISGDAGVPNQALVVSSSIWRRVGNLVGRRSLVWNGVSDLHISPLETLKDGRSEVAEFSSFERQLQWAVATNTNSHHLV